jgi:hypothetical protein
MAVSAAAIGKAAAAVLSDKRIRKAAAGIILGIITVILMPIAAVLGIFSGDVKIDTAKLESGLVSNMTPQESSQLMSVQTTMKEIDSRFTAAGLSDKVQEAQMLYVFVLSTHTGEAGFVTKFVNCFASGQTDAQLAAKLNSTFGTSVSAGDISSAAAYIKGSYIDTSHWTDPAKKNSTDLVLWAKNAADSKWGYVFGTCGTVLDEKELSLKKSQFPSEVGTNESFIRQHWLGRRTADCVGLIKGYSWYDPIKKMTTEGSGGMPDITADAMFDMASVKGTIGTIPEIPGLAVWHRGHIGIYIGGGQVVEAQNTHAGVIQTPLGQTGWTNWLRVPGISYPQS